VQRYLGKVSGPLMDRIDLHVEVTPVEFGELSGTRVTESSEAIRQRVTAAREIQHQRFAHTPEIHCNAMMPPKILRDICRLDTESESLLKTAMEKLKLSARAYDRILKVSRTIADLAAEKKILAEHVAEAIQYRTLDREGWGG
jgi:magnesium chelatase family protein